MRQRRPSAMREYLPTTRKPTSTANTPHSRPTAPLRDGEPKSIRDLGSGMNYWKKGLQQLLELILRKQMKRLVLTHKDRLLRFGAELVFTLCELQGIEIVIIHRGEQPSFEEEQAMDVLEIITVFSARLYGARSHQSKKLAEDETVQKVRGQLSMI